MPKKKKQLYKLTKAHLKFFAERVTHWEGALCTVDWQFVVHEEVVRPSYRARYEVFDESGHIHIYLNTLLDRAPTLRELDEAAFHEVFESVYLSPLRWMAKSQYSFQVVEEVTHRAMARATNTIYEAMK